MSGISMGGFGTWTLIALDPDRFAAAMPVCGGDVRFTVYPGVGHDSWTRTYDTPELYDWLLAHRRSDRE